MNVGQTAIRAIDVTTESHRETEGAWKILSHAQALETRRQSSRDGAEEPPRSAQWETPT